MIWSVDINYEDGVAQIIVEDETVVWAHVPSVGDRVEKSFIVLSEKHNKLEQQNVELLKALKELADSLEINYDAVDLSNNVVKAEIQARSAIAKAEGGER